MKNESGREMLAICVIPLALFPSLLEVMDYDCREQSCEYALNRLLNREAAEVIRSPPMSKARKPPDDPLGVTPGEHSDRSLLVHLRGGQQDAATELYLRYAQRLRALVRSRCSPELSRMLEPDDIVQSVFRRFFSQVLQGNYDVPPGEELWGLLLVIALNKIRTEEAYHRAGKRDVRLSNQPADVGQLPAPTDENAAHLQLCVEDALGQLSPSHRILVELRIQGHEVAEIAQKTGRSKRTVERILQEIRAQLRQLLVDVD
jgi:RNA polymerase sigma-70 factor (ECF subfamily)